MKKMNKKGFTLIEMLVVIAIIAILVAIVIPTVSNATEKARQAADVANIRSAVAQFQINKLNGVTDYSVFPAAKTAKASGVTYTKPAEGATEVTYTSTLLTDGNKSGDNKTYVWALGDLVTETTAASNGQG